VVIALAIAPAASAHAILESTDPPNGSVLATSPTVVTATFDSSVRVGTRNAAIRNDGTDVMGGAPFVRRARTLVIPLKPKLPDGQYSVRWSIVSDDGHNEEGVIAFAVGEGSGTPVSALGTRGATTWQLIAMRTVFFLGVLVAVGAAFFGVLVLRQLREGPAVRRRHAHLMFAGFLLAFAGADALIHETVGTATRFERAMDLAGVVSVAGGAAAALAPLWAPLLYAAWAAAAVLCVCPTLAGHAFDADQPRVLAPVGDLLHVGAAAVWLGGLASLAFVTSREPEEARRAAATRYASLAGPTVLLVAAAGTSRALTELTAVSQLWTTSYGRAILVKVGLFLALGVLGWLGRNALATAFARLRPIVFGELVLLLGVVVTVGTLTALRPGTAQSTASRPATPEQEREPPPPPPRGAYVDAAQAGRLAVGFSYLDGLVRITLTEPDGDGAADVPLTIEGSPRVCGRGCFQTRVTGRSVDVTVGATPLHFDVPARLEPAGGEVERLRRDFDSLRSVVIRERLSSAPGNHQTTVFRQAAPSLMAYEIVDASDPNLVGIQGIVIGDRRWDKLPGGHWTESPQAAVRLPTAYWTASARNAYTAGRDEVTFYDPTVPAWFRVRYDPATGHAVALRMVAAAHFMEHAYSDFDRPASISPPPSR